MTMSQRRCINFICKQLDIKYDSYNSRYHASLFIKRYLSAACAVARKK